MNQNLKYKVLLLCLSVSMICIFSFQNCAKQNFIEGPPPTIYAVATFKPALAVSDTKCLMCHTSVSGNFVSDLGFTNGSGDFYGATGAGTGDYLFYGYRGDSKDKSSIASAWINGTFYLPHLLINANSMTVNGGAQNLVSMDNSMSLNDMMNLMNNTTGQTYTTSAATLLNIPSDMLTSAMAQSSWTVAEFYNMVIDYRTLDYMTMMWPNQIKPKTDIREIASVNINAPTQAQILALIPPGSGNLYYRPTAGTDIQTLLGFSLSSNGKFYSNDLTGATPMKCDGDLVVNAPIFLKNLNLITHQGCRIYSTATVLIQGPPGVQNGSSVTHGIGIKYSSDGDANLQITSSREVMLGLGQCSSSFGLSAQNVSPNLSNGTTTTTSNGVTTTTTVTTSSSGVITYVVTEESQGSSIQQTSTFTPSAVINGKQLYNQANTYSPNSMGMIPYRVFYPVGGVQPPSLIKNVVPDYSVFVDSNNNTLPVDAGNCYGSWAPARATDFSRLLINAPRIDSRYTGDFSGVIIAKFALMSLGDFNYSYDPVFDNVPILPLLPEDSYFSATDCIINSKDYAHTIDTHSDGSTYKSCN